MINKTVQSLAVALLLSAAGHVAAAEVGNSLAGTWSLDDRSAKAVALH